MSKYIDIYNKVISSDPVPKGDPRRPAIIAEMRAVAKAKTLSEATDVISFYEMHFIDRHYAAVMIRQLARAK